MTKKKVLFVCVHNSARSQMAEELLRKLAPTRYEVTSAGIEPGKLNPIVVDILKEESIDITGKKTQGVKELIAAGRAFDYIITVCDETSAERCPVFPGQGKRLYWGFPDPSAFDGFFKDRVEKTRAVKDDIKRKIEEWLAS